MAMRKEGVNLCCCGHPWEEHIYRTVEPGSGTGCALCPCKMFTDKRISHRRAASKSTREAGPKAEIIKLLEKKGIRYFRMNSGSSHIRQGNHIVLNKKGTPDILCLIPDSLGLDHPDPLWIEVKKSDSKQSQEQVNFQVDAETNGETYLLARSAGDVAQWLEANRR